MDCYSWPQRASYLNEIYAMLLLPLGIIAYGSTIYLCIRGIYALRSTCGSLNKLTLPDLQPIHLQASIIDMIVGMTQARHRSHRTHHAASQTESTHLCIDRPFSTPFRTFTTHYRRLLLQNIVPL
jgi:hypothetical protein